MSQAQSEKKQARVKGGCWGQPGAYMGQGAARGPRRKSPAGRTLPVGRLGWYEDGSSRGESNQAVPAMACLLT